MDTFPPSFGRCVVMRSASPSIFMNWNRYNPTQGKFIIIKSIPIVPTRIISPRTKWTLQKPRAFHFHSAGALGVFFFLLFILPRPIFPMAVCCFSYWETTLRHVNGVLTWQAVHVHAVWRERKGRHFQIKKMQTVALHWFCGVFENATSSSTMALQIQFISITGSEEEEEENGIIIVDSSIFINIIPLTVWMRMHKIRQEMPNEADNNNA